MATQLFFRLTTAEMGYGTADVHAGGSSTPGWWFFPLALTRGPGVSGLATGVTPAGPTAGIPIVQSGFATAWLSEPLDADVTISGSITWNLWALESDMNANAAINAILYVMDGATGTRTLIDRTARVTEVGTSAAVNNFAETPAAGVACKRGDRLRVEIFADDAGTMGAGFSVTFNAAGTTGGANGDSYLTLTENLTFASEPAGSQIFPTDTASAVATASVDREAWTSRGAGAQNDVVNSTTGFTAAIQLTDTAGGTVVDWFTKPLAAFTLGGAVRVNIRAGCSNTLVRAAPNIEIARVANDGTSPTVWAIGQAALGMQATTELAYSFLIAGDDLAVSDQQRLRIRLRIDDDQGLAMVTGHTVTIYYAGAAGATGDTFVTFTQTLTEFGVAAAVPHKPHRVHSQAVQTRRAA